MFFKQALCNVGLGGSILGGVLQNFTRPFPEVLIIFWVSQLKPVRLAPLLGDLIKGGLVPGHRNAWNAPK